MLSELQTNGKEKKMSQNVSSELDFQVNIADLGPTTRRRLYNFKRKVWIREPSGTAHGCTPTENNEEYPLSKTCLCLDLREWYTFVYAKKNLNKKTSL